MKIKIEEIELSQKDFSFLMAVSRETIRNWEQRGMPSNKRGYYSLVASFIWWKNNIAVDPNESTLTEERKLKVQVERKLKELEYMMEMKDLIPKEEILSEFLARIAIVKQGLMSLHRSLPPILFGKEPREMAGILKGYTWQLLNKFSRRSGIFASSHGKKKN